MSSTRPSFRSFFHLRADESSLTIRAMGQYLTGLLSARGGQVSCISTLRHITVFLFFFFLPTQLAKHFWPAWSYVQGIRVDYLSPTVAVVDVLSLLIILSHIQVFVQFIRTARRAQVIVLGLLIGTNTLFSFQYIHSFLSWIHLLLNFAVVIIIGKELRKYFPAILAGLAMSTVTQLLLVTMQFIHQSSLQGIWYWLGERRIVLSLPDVAKISVYGREYLRPYGTFSHPNALGGYFVLLYFFIHWFKQHLPKNTHIALANIILFVCPFLVLLSFSKVAILSFVVGNLILVWRDFTYRKCLLCLVARSSVLIVMLLMFTIPLGDPYSLQKRLVLIENSFRIFVDHSLWGVGLGNYTVAQSSIQVIPRLAPLFQPVHNIFLLILTEIGLGGVMFVFYCIRQMRFVVPLGTKLLTIFMVVFITGLFDHYWVTQPQTQLLLIFVMVTTLFVYPNSQNEYKKRPL